MTAAEPHNPASHCFVVNAAGRQRIGFLLCWEQRPVATAQPRGSQRHREPYTEWHADVRFVDLDESGQWVVRAEWVHASRVIQAGGAARGVHSTVAPCR